MTQLGIALSQSEPRFPHFILQSARTVAPSSAKIGSISETFSQCFFNEMNRPVIMQLIKKALRKCFRERAIFADEGPQYGRF
jgi:hypothetical protein